MSLNWTQHTLGGGLGMEQPPTLEIDPYWHWLSLPGPGGTPVEDPGIASYVLRFADGAQFGRFRDWLGQRLAGTPEAPPISVPEFYLEQHAVPRADPFEIVVFAPPQFLLEAARELRRQDSPFSAVLAVGAPRAPQVPACFTLPNPEPVADVFRGGTADTIVAVIDTNIAWANARFRRSTTESRIAWFWDMDADCSPEQGLAIGREMFATKPAGFGWDAYRFIDDYLADFNQGGNVDEAGLYTAYQDWAYADLGRRRAMAGSGHGTHVMDCATGATAPATDAPPIFAVQLPRLAVEQTHGIFLSSYVQLALDRIQYLAERFKAKHVLVNYSFGGSAGRHDGLSQLEQDFDQRIKHKKLASIALPAGNSYEGDGHARFTGDELATQQKSLFMRAQPADGTPNFLQVWMPQIDLQQALHSLAFVLTPPVGPALSLNTGIHEMQADTFWELSNGSALARLYIQRDVWPPQSPHVRLKLTLAVHHTDQTQTVPGHGLGEPDMAGNWGMELAAIGDALAGEEVMVWVERDDRLPGARSLARPSYLVPQTDDPLSEGIRPDGTISDIGTGLKTIVTAGHRRSDHRPASYSSEGFDPATQNNPRRIAPTLSGPSEEAPALVGIIAAGTFSGSTRRMRGTSASTGLATRLGTDLLTQDKPVKNVVMHQAALDEGTIPNPQPPNPPRPGEIRIGKGRAFIEIPDKPPRRDA